VLALSHHYSDAPDQYYAERLQLNSDSVRSVLQKVATGSQVLRDYQELLKQLIRKKTGRDTTHSWDLGLLIPYHWRPMHFTEVCKLTNVALAPLGAAYQSHFSKLLNPCSGLLDIANGPNRAGGGNSFGSIGTPVRLYMRNFDGAFQSVSTLIHEGGNAIHRQLMNENKVISS